jgi:GMP synthase (glutamine-hydrolysing)
MIRLVVAQLAADSPPGLLLPWARRRGFIIDIVRADLGEPLPQVRDAGALVVVGSDASLRHTWLSWLAPTRAWVAEALATDIPVLGIGLGAQIMASVLGAEIEPAPTPEVGLVRVMSDDPSIATGPWLGYNEDTIVMPTAPWTTAFNDRGTQAFCTGPHLGLQFHAHATPDMVRGWERNGRFPVPPDLADDLSERIVTVASHTRALFSGWATRAGLDAPTAPLPLAVGG